MTKHPSKIFSEISDLHPVEIKDLTQRYKISSRHV